MKYILTILTIFALHMPTYSQSEKDINDFLEQKNIGLQTVSLHPNGTILISSSYNRESENNYLIHVRGLNQSNLNQREVTLDTLDVNRPSRSAFSKNGKYIIYNEIDDGQRTLLRSYDGIDNLGEEINLTEATGYDAMYYYSLQDSTFLFYTYVEEDHPDNGVHVSTFDGTALSQSRLVFPNGNNRVFFSPLLLDSSTMILAAHGQEDSSTNGVYISKRVNGSWQYPDLLKDLPYGYSFDWVDSNTVMYYTSGSVKFLKVEDILRASLVDTGIEF
jgi:hypothetical protein